MALNEDIIRRWHESEILLIGGSAGSFKPIYQAVQIFPSTLNKAVLIIIHRKKNFFSEIENLFGLNSLMLIREVTDKDVIRKNTIYLAPANYHTLIEIDKCFSLDVSEDIWYSRPAIDVSFESAADVYKDKCTAILYSGANEDGAGGLLKLRNNGALTIVQDPEEAEVPYMPAAAVKSNAADYILKNNDILKLLQA